MENNNRNWFSRWWTDCLWGVWTENRLLSRKWWIAAGSVAILVALDIFGLAPNEYITSAVQNIIIAYLGVQGAIDFFKYFVRNRVKPEQLVKNPYDSDYDGVDPSITPGNLFPIDPYEQIVKNDKPVDESSSDKSCGSKELSS